MPPDYLFCVLCTTPPKRSVPFPFINLIFTAAIPTIHITPIIHSITPVLLTANCSYTNTAPIRINYSRKTPYDDNITIRPCYAVVYLRHLRLTKGILIE